MMEAIRNQFNHSILNNPVFNYGEKKVSKYLGAIPAFLEDENFKGRSQDLQTLEKQLFEGRNILLLVNGYGGIGKTTLAAKYFERQFDKYIHLAWTLAEISILEALLVLGDAQNLACNFPPEASPSQRLDILLKDLRNLGKPCLLVIDNADTLQDLEAYYDKLRSVPNFHILLTTRIQNFEKAPFFVVSALSKEKALEMFQTYYTRFKASETELFNHLYTAIGGNTLVLELLAKNLEEINQDDEFYSLQKLLDDLQGKGLFGIAEQEKVKADYKNFPKTEPSHIIALMYDFEKPNPLSEAEKQALSNFAVLPAQSINFQTLCDLMQAEDKRSFSKTLTDLQRKGWLEKTTLQDENQTSQTYYKISPVIQEITKHKNQDQLPQDCQNLLEKLYFLFKSDSSYNLVNINHNQASAYYPFAQAVFLNMPEKSRTLGWLGIYLGDYDNNIGNLMKARESFESAKAIFQEIRDDYSYGVSLERLGNSFNATGNLEQALKYYAESRDLQERICQENPNNSDYKNSLAISYQNLGDTHRALGNLEKALEFFEEDMKLTKELYEAYPEQVGFKNGLAISYSKLGDTHSTLGNLEKALEFFEEETKLFEELYVANPEQVGFKNGLAVSYQNLGNTHSKLGNLNKAMEFFEVYNSLEKELYEAYPEQVGFKNSLAISYQWLGDTHSKLGNLKEAMEFFEAYNRLEKELYEAYPEQVGFKNGLAISCEKLGDTHSELGNLEKALEFFEACNRLEKELYEAYPEQVGFKNLLAISYFKMYMISLGVGNKDSARNYLQVAEKICGELATDFPIYPDFKWRWEDAKKRLQGLS